MAYLKALGVFRLVAEQKNPATRGYWRYDTTFVLCSPLDREALLGFFLEGYRPTPIITPWNGRYKTAITKGDKAGMDIIRVSQDERLSNYREVIEQSKTWVEGEKNLALAACRSNLPDYVIPWLDAAYVFTTDAPRYPPLMSNGGTLGTSASGDISMNFMQNLVVALSLNTAQRGSSRNRQSTDPTLSWLARALFGDDAPLIKGSVGQFNPGGVGGPNATTGFEGDSLVNPWDFVLTIEGALVFAGAVARRLTAESHSRATYPFTVETSAAGYGTAVDAEASGDGPRSEIWLPLWEQPATFAEISHLFGEGRAQLGKRQAATGTDFARAIVGLGVERGVGCFQRFGVLRRSGRGDIVTSLGRFRVTPRPEANLLFDLDSWLERLRRASRGQNVPGGLNRAMREIDWAILEFCAHGGPRLLQEVLIAIGQAERWLATARQKDSVRPLSGLTPGWLQECDDGSSEFRLAAALASIQGDRDRQVGSIRINLEPVIFDRGRWQWAEDQRSVVWHGGDALQAMTSVLERRCLEASMKALDHLPLEGRIAASLADVLAFLEGRLDYRRLADLLLPLTAINWRQAVPQFPHPPAPPALSRAYATLKLLFLPWDFRRHVGADELPIRPEPSILHLLRARRTSEASPVAYRRLRASDLTALTPEIEMPHHLEQQLAAALLIPIRYRDMYVLADMALMPASGVL
jgi:CRISPR-associated protein Csx17